MAICLYTACVSVYVLPLSSSSSYSALAVGALIINLATIHPRQRHNNDVLRRYRCQSAGVITVITQQGVSDSVGRELLPPTNKSHGGSGLPFRCCLSALCADEVRSELWMNCGSALSHEFHSIMMLTNLWLCVCVTLSIHIHHNHRHRHHHPRHETGSRAWQSVIIETRPDRLLSLLLLLFLLLLSISKGDLIDEEWTNGGTPHHHHHRHSYISGNDSHRRLLLWQS